jgi:hypothetical protein
MDTGALYVLIFYKNKSQVIDNIRIISFFFLLFGELLALLTFFSTRTPFKKLGSK